MKLDELGTEWRATNEIAATKVQREELIAATRHRVHRLWGQILRRDLTETIAAVFVAILFGRYLFATNFVVSSSALGLVCWALYVVFKLHRTRTSRKPASPDAPVREFCRIELDRLDRQITLQRRVLWWYIAPCMIGVNTFFIGLGGFGIASVVYGFVTVLLAWGIYRANMNAIANELTPRRQELASLLNQLGDPAPSPGTLPGSLSVELARRDGRAASRRVMLLARSSVLVAKIVVLALLLIGLFGTLGLFILRALGVWDSGSFSGTLVYFVGNLLLVWGIWRAKPVSVELSGKRALAATFLFIVLMVVIFFVNALAVATLLSEAFNSSYLIYGILTLLLAGGIYRAKSVAALSVMVLLATLAFSALTVGGFYSTYEGAPRSDGPAGASLADLVTDLRKEHKLVGLAAMVMVDGKVMSSAADGERKKGSGVPLELGDRWHLGSITKSITATMIGRLVEAGQMKWTDTIGERFSDASIHEDWKPVTLQQLLTHTSGAPANFSFGVSLKRPALGPECTRERRKAVIDVIAGKPAYPPGEKFAYSNVGYTIAAAMAESATGVSWEDLVKREVLEPLELTGAGFGPPKSPPKTLDQPRGHHGTYPWKRSATDQEDNTPIMGPAGAVHLTLRDLCNYAMEHLRGEAGAGKLLTAETYKRLHTPQLHDYACGWVMKQPTQEIPYKVYWHNGSNTMWYALVVFIPDKKMVIAVTSNDGDIQAAESAAWKVVKSCANQFPVDDATTTPPP